MEYFPLLFKLDSRRCVIVGGGSTAVRKATLLLKSNATISIVSPDVCSELSELIKQNKCEWIEGAYQTSHLDNAYLVIAATNQPAVNEQVSTDARALDIPVNVVDKPALCTFIFPAIVDRSPLVIAVSSGGEAPVLARLVRAKIETMIPAAYGRLALLAGEYRQTIKDKFSTLVQRRKFWEKVFSGGIAEHVFAGKEDQATAMLEELLGKEQDQTQEQAGEVYLVGAGPGDPDLLTFRALRLMQQADVVLYDSLVSDGIMELVRRDAERVYVGKRKASHTMPQEDINGLLVKLAKEGKRVCRLKGGDPFIFGRGGEELEEIVEAGISFQVVPGITAASGCSAYSGIPLTHRDYSQSVRFVTGHLKAGSDDLPWDQFVRENQTLVFYMGLANIPEICVILQKHGMSKDMPIALIEKGTTREQKTWTATLDTMPDLVANNDIHGPTLTIVGEVVKLHEKLNWYQE